MLCDIALMVNLVHKARCKPYLVAVGAVACGSGGSKLSLGELARYSIPYIRKRITAAGYTHRIIDIAPAGERIAYSTAHAGCRAAEGLYLGRMVMRFILEQHQPILVPAVNIDLDIDRTGVYLIRFIKIFKIAAALESLCGDACKVHKAYGLFIADAFTGS